ncbi:MAG: lipoprotein, partial [Candidatus Omnitrophica bacterium]|nr:lipoprotein [Candidatus Omnitrophota bacterium]
MKKIIIISTAVLVLSGCAGIPFP